MAATGAIYPVSTLLVLLVTFPLFDLLGEPLPKFGLWTLSALFPLTCVGAIFGVLGGLLGRIGWLSICLSLGLPIDNVRHVAFASGLAGMTLIGIVLALDPTGPGAPIAWTQMFLTFSIGPGIATPLFQLAGAWSEWPRDGQVPPPAVWRFGVRQVLITTVWVAVALAILKPLGVLTPQALVLFLAWIVYQWCTMRGVLRLLSWYDGLRINV